MAEAPISLDDLSFDESGRAIIANPATVARLRLAAADINAIKNIGCCSAAAELQAPDAFRRLSAAEAAAIKNIGCCSAL